MLSLVLFNIPLDLRVTNPKQVSFPKILF